MAPLNGWIRAGKQVVCGLLALLVGAMIEASGARADAEDPLGVIAVTRHVDAAVDSLRSAFERLPSPSRDALVAEVRVLAHAVTGVVERVREQPVPVVDPLLIHDLEYLSDVLHAFAVDLTNVGGEESGGLRPETAKRFRELSAAAVERIGEIEVALDRWDERTRQSLVDLEYGDDGAIVVHSVDRSLYGAIRYTALALLLVGLLAVGLQVLHMAAYRIDRRELLEGRTVMAVTAFGVLGLFFVTSLALVVFPGALAALSAKVEVARPEHPCRALQVQRDHLAGAQLIGSAYLIEGTKRRMQTAAEDCLGLPRQAVAAALEHLAPDDGGVSVASVSRTGVDRAVDGMLREHAEATATVAAPKADADRAAPPATPAPASDADEAAPAEERDVLAELLASIRTSDAATVEDDPVGAEDAVAPEEEDAAGAEEEDAAAIEQEVAAEPELFVTTTVVNYREGPNVDAPRLGTLISGARVNVVGREGDWSEIRLRDGRRVYVASEFLEPAS